MHFCEILVVPSMEWLVARGQLHHMGFHLEVPWTDAEEVTYNANIDLFQKQDTSFELEHRAITLQALQSKTWKHRFSPFVENRCGSCMHCYLTLLHKDELQQIARSCKKYPAILFDNTPHLPLNFMFWNIPFTRYFAEIAPCFSDIAHVKYALMLIFNGYDSTPPLFTVEYYTPQAAYDYILSKKGQRELQKFLLQDLSQVQDFINKHTNAPATWPLPSRIFQLFYQKLPPKTFNALFFCVLKLYVRYAKLPPSKPENQRLIQLMSNKTSLKEILDSNLVSTYHEALPLVAELSKIQKSWANNGWNL